MSRPFSSRNCLAKPKSIIRRYSGFSLSSTYNMFDGFKSRWTTFNQNQNKKMVLRVDATLSYSHHVDVDIRRSLLLLWESMQPLFRWETFLQLSCPIVHRLCNTRAPNRLYCRIGKCHGSWPHWCGGCVLVGFRFLPTDLFARYSVSEPPDKRN